jgi:CheY-like chemotaxis protein
MLLQTLRSCDPDELAEGFRRWDLRVRQFGGGSFQGELEVMVHRPAVQMLTATLGHLGLELARQQHPDLILLDLHLPDMRGDEFLRRMQESAQTRDIPVVILSADGMPRQIEQLRAAGAREYSKSRWRSYACCG